MVDEYKIKVLMSVLHSKGVLTEDDLGKISNVEHLLGVLVDTNVIGTRDMTATSKKFVDLALRILSIKSTCPPGSLVENVEHVLAKENWLTEADRKFIIEQMKIQNKGSST